MAFASTYVKRVKLASGLVIDKYTWSGATATTGTITLQTSTQPEITDVEMATASNDADNAVVIALDAGQNKVKLTFTSGDSGTVSVLGVAR